MTDRGRSALSTSENTLQVGPSQMHWNGASLVINVNEVAGPPVPGRLRGQITVTPRAMTGVELPLTDDGAHVWRPFAPLSDISVRLEGKGRQWDGKGYFDANFGTRALEADFDTWTWGCFPKGPDAIAAYDVRRRDGSQLDVAVRFNSHGAAEEVAAPGRKRFRRSLWAVARETRADTGTTPRQVLPMLDAPFYCRSAVETTIEGDKSVGVHEALDLRRFRWPLLKPMLAVRVPRRRHWG